MCLDSGLNVISSERKDIKENCVQTRGEGEKHGLESTTRGMTREKEREMETRKVYEGMKERESKTGDEEGKIEGEEESLIISLLDSL